MTNLQRLEKWILQYNLLNTKLNNCEQGDEQEYLNQQQNILKTIIKEAKASAFD